MSVAASFGGAALERKGSHMYRETAKLVVFRKIPKDSILMRLSEICEVFETEEFAREDLISDIYVQINRILDVATKYAFDDNLWHCYLAYLLATNENPFTLITEKVGAAEGSVNKFVKHDLRIFLNLFHYDFSRMERILKLDCFSTILHYRAIEKKEGRYNRNESEKIRQLSRDLAAAADEEEAFVILTDFYRDYGVGSFGMNKAFGVVRDHRGLRIYPISNTEDVRLSDLVGYETQKRLLIANTEAFVSGRKANNCLLYGDSGTGKSTSIKALLNEYYGRGLRMIEVYKHQFQDLSAVIAKIKNRNYYFIIYMDDLSFEDFEVEYKYLKALIEGGLENKPDNVLIYATSNRKNIIRETWKDREDMDFEIRRSESMQEKISLASRFGITINYSRPSQNQYFEIVKSLAKKYAHCALSEEALLQKSHVWELQNGGFSGRTAQQFINHLQGEGLLY